MPAIFTSSMAGRRGDSDDAEPHEAFHLFGNELRVDILLALNEAEDYSLTFAEVQSAVGKRDSGKFSYHLTKLEGLFVENIDDQYVLKPPGRRVIDLVRVVRTTIHRLWVQSRSTGTILTATDRPSSTTRTISGPSPVRTAGSSW